MILNGVIGNSREYGRLVGLAEEPNTLELLRTRKQFHVGHGLIILQTQEQLLGSLVQCSLNLLHNTLGSAMTKPHISTESEIGGFESLGQMTAEAPYRAPGKLDVRIPMLMPDFSQCKART
ncbi:unnamed protein product [Penicillium bialowiezense]